MSEHSPGPWVFDESDHSIYCGDVWPCVASFSDADLPSPANGRLMAAAPDMLRLLRVLARMSKSGPKDKEGWIVWDAALNEASELIATLDGEA
jgi:hypothetical protein